MIDFLRITGLQKRRLSRLLRSGAYMQISIKKKLGLIWLVGLCLPVKSAGQDHVACATGQQQDVGLGVFGDMTIHDGAPGVWGTLVLDRVQVRGKLTLADHIPQRIIARLSRVEHLLVTNPTRVTLQGDLTIDGALRVKRGVFDARLANLVFSDSAKRVVGPGGRLLLQSTQYSSVRDTYTRLSDPIPVAVLPVERLLWVCQKIESLTSVYRGRYALSVLLAPQNPPPEIPAAPYAGLGASRCPRAFFIHKQLI